MTRRFFGTDGVRGRVGETLITPEFILRLGWAAGRVFGQQGGAVVIGKDTRISGYMFESALEAGLIAAGVDVLLTGPMPTPAIAYLTRTFHAAAGIVISASHNPYYDNGIKFFSSDGNKLPDDVELQIEAELNNQLLTVPSEKLGKARRITDAAGRYIEFCKSTIPAGMTLHGLKVVVDCANGATYHVTPNVFRELGADVTVIGADPDGLNINDNIGSTHPQALQNAVLESGADLGIALDGDGDRVVLVDHAGRLVDGDEMLYVIALSRQQTGELHGPVVGTVMTNLGLELALKQQGIGLVRTSVGDRYIIEQLLANDWTLGGEPSGHIICRDRISTGDGTVAALQVAAEMVTSGRSLKQLTSQIERCPQTLVNVTLDGVDPRKIMSDASVEQSIRDAENTLGEDGRVLLRPSGTEPLIRVMTEGVDGKRVTAIANQLADSIRSAVDNLRAG